MNEHTFQVGDTVRIITGAHGGRVGKVRHIVATGAIHVEFQAPVLLTQPEGPTKSVTLPFSRRELVAATDLIPAGPGKRRRLSLPVPTGEDHASKAECRCQKSPDCQRLMRHGLLGSMAACPAHSPATYALYSDHRKGVAA